jgi:hypothetical protein
MLIPPEFFPVVYASESDPQARVLPLNKRQTNQRL